MSIDKEIIIFADKGYQVKKPKDKELDESEKLFNRKLNQEINFLEHIQRNLKKFKILSTRYRNRRKRLGLRCKLIPGIYNYEMKNQVQKININ